MNRRLDLTLVALLGAAALSSCSTVDNRVATVNGKKISYDTFKAYALKATGGTELPQSGEETRTLLTKMIAADFPAASDDQAKAAYEKGFNGSPLICVGAIALADPAKSTDVKAALQGGTALADVAKQYGSAQQAQVAPDGVVASPDAGECYSPDTLQNTDLRTSLSAVPVGEGVDFSAGGTALVVVLRPWDSLKPASRSQIAGKVGASQAIAAAKVSVSSKYGRWDPQSGTVIADG